MTPELIRSVRYRRSRPGRRLLGPGLKALFWLVVTLALARAALPAAVRYRAQAALSRIDGFEGRVAEVDLALWRGACVYRDVRLEKEGGGGAGPFFHAAEVQVTVAWADLLRGPLTARMVLTQPALNAVSAPAGTPSQTGLGETFIRRFAELSPAPVDRLEVREGAATYRDLTGPAPLDLALRRVELLGVGLAAGAEAPDGLGAVLSGSAEAFHAGRLRVHARADPRADPPSFELEADARDVKFSESFELLRGLAGFEAPGGSFELAVSASAKDGELTGKVEPLFHNLYLSAWSGRKTSPLRAYREAVAAAGGQVLETPGKDRIAARVPLRGALAPGRGLWLSLASALHQGFLQAFAPGQKKEKKT